MQAEQREHQEQHAKHGDVTGFLLGFFCRPVSRLKTAGRATQDTDSQNALKGLGPAKKVGSLEWQVGISMHFFKDFSKQKTRAVWTLRIKIHTNCLHAH